MMRVLGLVVAFLLVLAFGRFLMAKLDAWLRSNPFCDEDE
jgi:hypothetical protein